jgi:hypothetical protein
MVRTAPRRKRHCDIFLDATALYDAGQGLFTTEELGDADRQAPRHEQGQGGLARQLAVSCIACLPKEPLQRCSSLT